MKKVKATITAGKDMYGVWLNDYPVTSASVKIADLKADLKNAIDLTLEINEDLRNDLANCEIEYIFDTTAIIKYYGELLGYPALHKITGVNAKQLWNYANSGIKPRIDKASKILDSLKNFGKDLTQFQIFI